MSRKYNGHRKGKKARGVGTMSTRKHRASGGKGHVRQSEREATCRLIEGQKRLSRERRRRLRRMYPSVLAAMRADRS